MYFCVANDRTAEAEARCDAARLLAIFLRLGRTPGDVLPAPGAADGAPRRAPGRAPAPAPDAPRPAPDVTRAPPMPGAPADGLGPQAPRHAVAFERARGGGWAVGSGSGFMAVGGPPTLTLGAGVDPATAAFLRGVGTARALAMGAGGVTAVTDASGATAVHKAEAGRFCERAVANLQAALDAAGRADADVVLHPTSCEWMLIAGGRATVAPGATSSVWRELRADVQGRLDAGERPVVAMHPDGRGYVVVTPSVVLRGDGVPASFEQALYDAQRGAVGEIHAVALHPERFAEGASGEATGFVVVGRAGYLARGVDRALCDAVEAVAENEGRCEAAVGGPLAAGFDPGRLDPTRPVIVRDGVLRPMELPRVSSTPPTPAGFLSPQRDRIAVLVHGITPEPGAEANHNVGTVHHTVRYWGWDFLSTLLYRHDSFDNAGVHLLSRRENARGEVSLQEREITANEWFDCTDVPAYSTCQARTPWPYNFGVQQNTPVPGLAPVLIDAPEADAYSFGAMVTFRDGSVRFGEQVAATVNQVYDTYQAYFGHLAPEAQPQLAFMAHSFGGIVSRALLSLGDDATAAALAEGNEALYTPELRDRAAFLRDRTVHLTTLSTPHTGSPLIGMTQQVHRAILGYESSIPYGDGALSFLTDFVGGGRVVLDDINELADDSGGRLNASVLHPAKARRGDGSMVPVYTLGGRSPGGPHLYSAKTFQDAAQNRASLLDMILAGRHTREAAGQFIFDGLLARLGYGPSQAPWGHAAVPEGDLLSRAYARPSSLLALDGAGVNARAGLDGLGGVRVSASYDATADVIGEELANRLATRRAYRWSPDGAYDSDGLVGFPSSHGLGMMGPNEPLEYFGNEEAAWSVPTGIVAGNTAQGSWYRLYEAAYGDLFPWDFDNHGSMTFNPGNGAYLHNLLYNGPRVGAGPWSTWDSGDAMPPPRSRSVQVEVTRLEAIGETQELEAPIRTPATNGADWTLTVQVGQSIRTVELESGNTWTGSVFGTGQTSALVVPVRISVLERDNPPADPHDPVHLSSETGREALVFYVDTFRGHVYGDVEGRLDGSRAYTLRAPAGNDNRAEIDVRIAVR